jgi:predicted dehydrogenase
MIPSASRRQFLRAAGTAAAAPLILPSRVWGQGAPSKTLTMGFIGMGKQSGGLLNTFLHEDPAVRVLAVCDVDTTRREAAKGKVNEFYAKRAASGASAGCAAYNDYRELIARQDIDAVCIATPDHWHAAPTLAALLSGKDVYCEKPLTHTIEESRRIIAVTARTGRVLQTGSMQRSSAEFRIAAELVRNGVIGDVVKVDCSFGDPPLVCKLPEEAMEPGLDWDRWVGPAAMRPYNPTLAPRGVHGHFPKWRDYGEFGGGYTCDWGAHHLDIAQWGLGTDDSGPVKALPPSPMGKRGAVLEYANGVRVTHVNGFGVHFVGKHGEVKVNRGKFELHLDGKKFAGFVKKEDGTSLAAELKKVETAFLGEQAKVKLYNSRHHLRDFLDCVRSRQKPITNEIIGGRTAICCHLMNVVYKHQVPVGWEPVKMEFTPGGGQAAWATKEYRAGYELPA